MIDPVVRCTVGAQPTVVVAAVTTWSAFPAVWRPMLDEVWGCLRAAGIARGCPNVMLYVDDRPQVEVGVSTAAEAQLSGRVARSALPAGSVATARHHGPYQDLGLAHDAVRGWCVEQGIQPAGPRWEIYGPHRDDPAELTVDVAYLLA